MMPLSTLGVRPTEKRSRSRRAASRRARGRRGVSDVVATILILALTVTLFASIFAFVGSFPPPTPQNVNQFDASLVLTPNGSYIKAVNITHGAGPLVPSTDHVFLSSSSSQAAWQFHIGGAGIPVAWGIGNSSNGWNLGVVWSTTFTKLVKIPDNITVYITSPTQLLYSTSLPGPVINIPPAIESVGTIPTTLSIGHAFQITATLAGNLSHITATLNFSAVKGWAGPTTATMAANGSGQWVYNASATALTTNGTSYVSLIVTNAGSQKTSQVIPLVVGSSGGGAPSPTISVTVGVAPQPFSSSTSTPGTNLYPWATVTYTGSKANVSVYVNFSVVQAQGGKGASAHMIHTTIAGPTGNKITGPTSITIYTTTPFSWWLNTTDTVYANVSLPSVGTATGTTTFGPYNLVIGYTYFTTSSTGSTSGNTTTASHTCSSTSCPYLWLTVKFATATYYSAASLTFSGYVNVTCLKSSGGSCGVSTQSYTIASPTPGTVTQGGSTVINVITDTTSGTTRWTPPTGGGVLNYDYTATMTLTITSGTTVVGYLWDTALLNFTT